MLPPQEIAQAILPVFATAADAAAQAARAVAVGATCLAMTVTPYTPSRGGINGDRITADRTWVDTRSHMRVVACGFRYPYGTVFTIPGLVQEGSDFGRAFVCHDRGGMIGTRNLDILIFSGEGPRTDWEIAKMIGRRRMTACVIPPEAASQHAAELELGLFAKVVRTRPLTLAVDGTAVAPEQAPQPQAPPITVVPPDPDVGTPVPPVSPVLTPTVQAPTVQAP